MPVAYVLLSKLYQALHYGLRRYRERLFDYRGRYWGAQTLEDIAGYWDTRNDPHKNAFLLEVIAKYSPSSLLELGANCGNKLYCIAREYPNARLVGLDISQVAVDYGTQRLKEAGIQNVHLQTGRAEELGEFADGSFDVVFSWATLIYPRPSQIEGIIAEMLRIARRAVVLLEMQTRRRVGLRQARGMYRKGNWKRDYVQLISHASSAYGTPEVTWIPTEIWQPGGGGGAVVEASRRPASQ